MRNRSAAKRDTSLIPQPALVCGEAFQRLAERIIPRIIAIKEESSALMPKELADVAACAANLAFAIELYLKALLAVLDLPVPQSHDLRALFDELPEAVRFIIEKIYMEGGRKYLKVLGPHRGRFVLATGPSERPRFEADSNAPILPDLLERSKDLFQSWRYLCEVSPPDGSPYQFRTFDYGLLWAAAEAMRVEVMVRLHEAGVITLPDAPPDLKRTKTP